MLGVITTRVVVVANVMVLAVYLHYQALHIYTRYIRFRYFFLKKSLSEGFGRTILNRKNNNRKYYIAVKLYFNMGRGVNHTKFSKKLKKIL